MTTKRIVFTRADGGLSIVVPSNSFMAKFATEEEGLAAVQAKSVEAGAVNIAIVQHADIESNRVFRDAWVRDTGPGRKSTRVDMPKARAIHMNRIRRARDAALGQADIDLAKAEDGNDAPELARQRAERQRLRDIPQTFNLLGEPTPEALHALWPEGLDRP